VSHAAVAGTSGLEETDLTLRLSGFAGHEKGDLSKFIERPSAARFIAPSGHQGAQRRYRSDELQALIDSAVREIRAGAN
jgi:hypothetical protein